MEGKNLIKHYAEYLEGKNVNMIAFREVVFGAVPVGGYYRLKNSTILFQRTSAFNGTCIADGHLQLNTGKEVVWWVYLAPAAYD